MSNFTINFSYAWLLLLLIPVLFLALFPHFRVAKKYRRTRNRITSLVLHCVIVVLSVLVLSGLTFEYDVPNDENEILLLVDASYSTETAGMQIDDFVKDVIDYSNSRYKVGVVTFGYDQVYAAPLSYDGDEVYRNYSNAALPDTSATDIESALTYARTLLKYPETSKIVIVSDGTETDGRAASVIRNIAADGVHVDTKYFHGNVPDEVEVIAVDLPEQILVDNPFSVTVTVQSSYAGEVGISMLDNGEDAVATSFSISEGANTVTLQHTFTRLGMHVLTFNIDGIGDNLVENNVFTSYVYLENFDKLLIFESNSGESAKFKEILTDAGYQVDVADVNDPGSTPNTLSELCAYDQVIMMNVSNADMPEGLDEILNSYVYTVGGGMFTVGGTKMDEDGNITANMYNRDDMLGTLYQRMLPVQAIDYTPPLGLQIVIDHSGSMNVQDSTGRTRLDAAKDGAFACLDVLNDRDWCGIVEFDDDFDVKIELTRATQKTAIREAINSIILGNNTVYNPALTAAGEGLKLLRDVEKKHILFITDGQPFDRPEVYLETVRDLYDSGITISVVGIGITENSSAAAAMAELAEVGGGEFYRVTDLDKLRDVLRDDLTMETIRQYIPKEFTPIVVSHSGFGATVGLPDTLPTLGGYYGTRLKSDARQMVVGDYVPLYAEWEYGAGKVGSFMCDLKGTPDSWSQGFMSDPDGVKFLVQVVKSLFPSKSVRPTDITLELREQNYRNQMSIFTTFNSDEHIDVTVFKVSDDGETEEIEQSFTAGAEEDYSRVNIITMQAGVYRILVEKANADGVVSSSSIFKTFSYSAEYNVFVDNAESSKFLESLAALGKGNRIEVASEVYLEFVDKIHRIVDPRLAMIIIALILFLIDIAVRKFKFKWPHELIREYREKKNS